MTKTKRKNHIKTALSKKLNELGISQRDLAAALRVSESYVSHIIAGRRVPSLTIASRLANALRIELTELEVILHAIIETR